MHSIKFISVVLLFILSAKVVMAARGPDIVQKEFNLSTDCKTKLVNELNFSEKELQQGIKIATDSRVLRAEGDYISAIVINHLQSTSAGLKLSGQFNDMSGAMPRRTGSRYTFISQQVANETDFKGFWLNVFRLIKAKGIPYQGAHSVTLCHESSPIIFSMYKKDGYSNQYGSKPDMMMLEVGIGETIPAIGIINNLLR